MLWLQETKRVLDKLGSDIESRSDAIARERVAIEVEAEHVSTAVGSDIVAGYVSIGECLTAMHKWSAIWPPLKLWLHNEAAAVESVYSSADVLGLLGEQQELLKYKKLSQVYYTPYAYSYQSYINW